MKGIAGLFKRGKKEREQGQESAKKFESRLVVLTDKRLPHLRLYLNQNGLNVSEMCYNIEDAKIDVMLHSENTRIIIVETGSGIFTTVEMRKELSDLMGMCDSDNVEVTVLYSTNIIKADNEKKYRKIGIDWIPYVNTRSIIEAASRYNEEYTGDSNVQQDIVNVAEVLRFVGVSVSESK